MSSKSLYWFRNFKGAYFDTNTSENSLEFRIDLDVGLIKLKNNEYLYTQKGIFRNIIITLDDTILIDKRIGDILKKYVSDQIELTDTKIYRKSTNECWNNYYELEIKNKFNFNDYHRIKSNEVEIYKLINVHIYVSFKLKEKIESEVEELEVEFKQSLPVRIG